VEKRPGGGCGLRKLLKWVQGTHLQDVWDARSVHGGGDTLATGTESITLAGVLVRDAGVAETDWARMRRRSEERVIG
jgi:hypothetical protein